nr:DUF4388 domain-containing protein [Deinococcus wulumuqiensis]
MSLVHPDSPLRGDLHDLPLPGLLDLLHDTRQTGVLRVEAAVNGRPLPFQVSLVRGEVTGGAVVDWSGMDALMSCPPEPQRGRFEFVVRPQGGTPPLPYAQFVAEWARISDEWRRICAVIGSPSRRWQAALPGFEHPEGRSVRAALPQSGQTLPSLAGALAQAVLGGQARPIGRFAWFGLRLDRAAPHLTGHPVARWIDGQRDLGALADLTTTGAARAYLLAELEAGLRFPGCGWVWRDLLWETETLDEPG